ncbi:hypothetical protein SASPL_139705 [Salvia splendens]|uniref:Uncharacterized protein n=1 Tax=Salvia splendens TaxID=180675 RepID=A0A8X8WMI7_SALSN|nr:hypothetical protein SASPL_139705 [Salvia splendens]
MIGTSSNRQPPDWTSRLSIAATIADALAYMHEELHPASANMGYGLMLDQGQDQKGGILANGALQEAQDDYKAIFKVDSYAFGLVLLELLTGRMVLIEGLDLATWVVAVVREEWTVEVFDKDLMRECINEERMVRLLRIAIKCVAKPPEARPSMRQVALAIGSLREEDKRSLDVSDLSVTRSFAGL